MSRIADLITDLCPDGVEFMKLADVLRYEQPGKYLVSSTNYDASYPIPVLTAGQTFNLGYTDESDGIYPASKADPVVIFDDFTTAFKWVDFAFKAKSSAMKMLRPVVDSKVLLRFAYYTMQTIGYRPQDHARQWIGTYSQLCIPVPPLEVQREVVRILDTFTELEAKLKAELEARRRQYSYYRDSLLTSQSDWDVARMSDIAMIRRGTAITEKEVSEGNIPVVANGPIPTYLHGESNRNGETIVVARSGAYAGLVSFWNKSDRQ